MWGGRVGGRGRTQSAVSVARIWTHDLLKGYIIMLTSSAHPIRDPFSMPLSMMLRRFAGGLFRSNLSVRPPVKSSIASAWEPPLRASYDPCSLQQKSPVTKRPTGARRNPGSHGRNPGSHGRNPVIAQVVSTWANCALPTPPHQADIEILGGPSVL